MNEYTWIGPFVCWELGTSKKLVDFRVFRNDARPLSDSQWVPIEFTVEFILTELYLEN